MDSAISKQCVIGSAYISSSGHVFMADTGFHALAEYDIIESLRTIIVPEDWKNFEKSVEDVEKNGVTETSFRVKCESGTVRRVIAYLYKDEDKKAQKQLAKMCGVAYTDDYDGGIGLKCYKMELTSIDRISHKVEELENRLQYSKEFLDVMNSILISYDISKDELKIFSTERVPTYYYVGSLAEFYDDRLERKLIFEDHVQIFEEFVDDLRRGIPNIKLALKAKILGNEDEFRWYDIVGKASVVNENKRVVFARIQLGGDGQPAGDIQSVTNSKDFGTGLANKATIFGYARNLIESQPDHEVAIAVIDLDNFKSINDTYGHKFGDEVLAKVASIVKEAVGDKGMAGRIGGDEMFVVYDNLTNRGELRGLLRTIRTNVEWSYKGIRDELEISCSIGAASYPQAGHTFDELFEVADKLLYLAKEKGRNRYIMYVPEYHEEYIKGNMNVSATLRNVDKIRYNRDGVMAEILERGYKNGDLLDADLLEKLMKAYELDVISIIHGQTYENVERISLLVNNIDVHDYLEDEGYQDLFDEAGLCVVNSITFVEMWSKKAYEMFKNENVSTIIQYKYVADGEVKGYVSFGRSTFNKKWTELDIAILIVIAKVYSMNIFK